MKEKRRRHDPEFKARVALEAIKGLQTIQQIAKGFEVHPVEVSELKKAMIERATCVFGLGRENANSEDFERQRDELHAKIG
jgi:hypothetical protein